jgi:hypothetical protein
MGLRAYRPVVKIIAKSLSQHYETHFVPIPLSVRKGRKKKKVMALPSAMTVIFLITK